MMQKNNVSIQGAGKATGNHASFSLRWEAGKQLHTTFASWGSIYPPCLREDY
jgi:hypothetical protein